MIAPEFGDEPVCVCGDEPDDHVFTGGGFCNLCECERYRPRVTLPGSEGGVQVAPDDLAAIAGAAAAGGRVVGRADVDLAAVWQEGHVAGEIDAHAPPNKYPTPNPYASAFPPDSGDAS